MTLSFSAGTGSSGTAASNFFHLDPTSLSASRGDRVEAFLAAFAAILETSNYRFLLDLYARTSSKCGRCSVTCQVYQATGDWRDVPCYRTKLLLDVYRRYFTPAGSLQARFSRNGYLKESTLEEMAELFYRCNACRRCKLECPMGVDHALVTHLGRYILSEAGIAPKGLVVPVREQLDGLTGNTSAIPLPALLDNLEFLQEEVEEMKGAPVAFPVDQHGSDYIFFPAVSDYLMEADTLMGIAAVLKAAGVSWTIGSGYFDGINYGLFYNDWVLEKVIGKLVGETRRLNAGKILIGECGHASRSAKQYVPAFASEDSPPVVSILELTWQVIREGRVELDPTAIPERVTYHDPCNLARSGWLVEQPRQILHSFVKEFVEMQPHGSRNYCCGGGGGLVSLDETHKFRMQVSGRTKAEQIRTTGAEIVATPCANCKKQLRELMDYYQLPVQVVGVHDLILRAIKF
ncbi:MAG: (Fe-S)-binding protein [Chloroflexi bacterium]|mgnify:CR=1 FL=1|jgi:Fe-S oxidoreductase|nr:(Fe-S)-binding protein [Chloroflexota bacterium]